MRSVQPAPACQVFNLSVDEDESYVADGIIAHNCGYVGVPREHPAYGKQGEDVDVEVHGGVNYAHTCAGEICHVPAPGMPDDVWWLGFDCAHAGDLAPGIRATLRRLDVPDREGPFRDVYRALPYVRREIESLAEQLRAIAEAA